MVVHDELAMIGFHAGAIAALFFPATAVRSSARSRCTAVAGMLGIGMGYHRLLTHRGYKTYKWCEYALTWCGTLALEGGPIFWVATHRIHHQHSDREGDPHSPREGTWWAHAGWILSGVGLHHDSAVLRALCTGLDSRSRPRGAFPMALDLERHRRPGLLAYGGIPYVLWGIFFRTTVGLHATWLVNRRRTSGDRGASRRATIRRTTGGWRC
jgi:stearoyl-CoA desaturase (delta-9 desaturase)